MGLVLGFRVERQRILLDDLSGVRGDPRTRLPHVRQGRLRADPACHLELHGVKVSKRVTHAFPANKHNEQYLNLLIWYILS